MDAEAAAASVKESAAKIVFGPMVSFFTALYSTWRSTKKEDREFRQKVYSEQFLPAFTRLEEIHKDYLTSFHEFFELARKFETPPIDLLQKFRSYGIKYATWREDLRFFVGVCKTLTKDYRLKAEKDAIDEFADAVAHYFEVTFPDGTVNRLAPSWFSSFLSQFESLVRKGQSPWDGKYDGLGYGDNPKDTFMNYLKTVYQKELPERWKRVNKAKSELQGILFTAR